MLCIEVYRPLEVTIDEPTELYEHEEFQKILDQSASLHSLTSSQAKASKRDIKKAQKDIGRMMTVNEMTENTEKAKIDFKMWSPTRTLRKTRNQKS